jgi:hypothetical protein
LKIDKEVWKAIKQNQEAYYEGSQAFINGKDKSACQYLKDTPQYWAWRAGFLGVC